MKRQRKQCFALVLSTVLSITVSPLALGEPEKNLTSFPQHIDLSLAIEQDVIVAFAPAIARIRLTNRGDVPYGLDVRKDGAPYALMFTTAHNGEERFRHDQWIRRSGPQKHKVVLAPGDSTEGDVLIFFGPPTGFAFSDPGVYSVQVAFQPDQQPAPVYTNEVLLNVVKDDRENRVFIGELNELAYEHFGFDREILRRNQGERILIGYQLMHEILKVQGPHLIDPEGDAYNRERARLVKTLTRMFERYPDSSYAGYIARFLGLVHVMTFEHGISHRGAGSWGETKASPDHKEVTQLCQSEYEKALRYLTNASQADLWPRTTAAFQLARLHGIAEEWDKVDVCLRELRTEYADSDGVQLADELERQMAKYKAKLGRHKAAAP